MNQSTVSDSISCIGPMLGFSLADCEHIVHIIIGLISLTTTIVSGIISIVIKIKHSLKDGKITEDELNEIKDEVDKFKENVDKERKDRKN